MPKRVAVLSREAAVEHAVRRGFFLPRLEGPDLMGADRVGIELEMLPMGLDGGRASHDAVRGALEALGPLASGTSVTFEPGGQLELSSPRRPTSPPRAPCSRPT